MFCGKCGTKIPEGKTWCPKCGTPVHSSSAGQNQASGNNPNGEEKFYQKKWFLILMGIFLPPAGIFLLWKFTRNDKRTKTILTAILSLWTVICLAAYGGGKSTGAKTYTKSAASYSATETTKATTATTTAKATTADTAKQTTATVKETTKAETQAATKAETQAETTQAETQPETTAAPPETAAPVSELSVDIGSSYARNETATCSIVGQPDTEYTISVMYSSGKSKADGLEAKTSDSDGNVSWSWKIGGKTKLGTVSVTVSGGGQSKTVSFEVVG